ncbi:LysR family transcriptional regulator [Alicyclobacillus sp. SO9]|uniref:LysR family transcriptional regulator n=1 Tax=Alicyclobacillus sp. SO9 TaxID=2665646 RepID=UPI0018E7C165|nr:LysR family transcriptional regulator [Alicyclobacillus sp. SO9]QQE77248.1 LysR family transcriptional regulator [Alicyclobacillus sp. SO9]
MELKQLQTFKVLTEELNFTHTAARLNYAQSSVTGQIQALEQELGVQLFERLGKQIRLTEAGARLLPYAKQILSLAEEAHLSVPDDRRPSGTLTIGAVESLCTYRLAPVLMEFRAQYPDVELVFKTGICADLRRQVLQGDLDLAFTLEEAGHDERLVFEVLMQEPMLVLARKGHPLEKLSQVMPSDLKGETLLVTEPGCSYRMMFESSLAADAPQNPRVEFASVEAIKQWVMAGLGVALLPQMAVEKELQNGELVSILWAGPDFPVVTQMCWHKDKWMSPAMHSFVGIVQNDIVSQDQISP